MINNIKKSDGSIVPFNPERLNRWAEWAANFGVNWSEIVLDAVKRCFDGCSTTDLQNAMIDACVDRKTQAHAMMAGRILVGTVYKEAFGGFRKVPSLKDFYHDMTGRNLWIKMTYTDQELDEINEMIDHSKDLTYGYAVIKQFRDKYSIRNAKTKRVHESPQFMFMGMAMYVMQNQPVERRMDDIKNLYTYLSDLKINAPTPYLNGLRATNSGYASCCLITANDSAKSIGIATSIAYEMTVKQAGIGMNLQTRSIGDGIRQNTISHQGKIPYYRHVRTAVAANKQQCYSDDTEIMTRFGWKLIKDLSKDDEVAQVTEGGCVSFTKPTSIFSYEFDGDLIRFNKRHIDILVTDNHEMLSKKVKHDDRSKKFSSGFTRTPAAEWEPKRTDVINFGGANTAGGFVFTNMHRLHIALAADGNVVKLNDNKFTYRFGFKKSRKVKRLTELLDSLEIEYTTHLSDKGVTTIKIKSTSLKLEKSLSWLHNENISAETAKEILLEVAEWDGHWITEGRSFEFTSFTKTEVDTVQWLCALAGVYSSTGIQNRCYVYLETDEVTGEGIKKEKVPYSGKVYCVEVPTHNIIVRRAGRTLVCGNSRGGSATVFFPCLDPQVEDLLRLKNPTTVDSKRINEMDYGFQMNQSFIDAVKYDRDWILVSRVDAPELYELFYRGDAEGIQLFENAMLSIKNSNVKHKVIKARELAKLWIVQHFATGRVYPQFVTEANRHTPFKDPIVMSNLCMEILLPTFGFNSEMKLHGVNYENPEDGEVALCFLASLVAGRISDEEYEDVAYYCLLMIDNVMDMMDYPYPSMKKSVQARRSVGVGITNLAHYLAKNYETYSSREGKTLIHELAERHSYWLHKGSLRLAKEKGVAEWMDRTKYPEGWVPTHTQNTTVDTQHDAKLNFDWEALSEEIKANGGIRHSVLEAIAPNESSSLASGTTNSVYPIREGIMFKKSASGSVLFIAPDWEELEYVYQKAWDVPTTDLIDCYSILQKFTGQSISSDLYVDYTRMKVKKVSMAEQLKLLIYRAKMGMKTGYYTNFRVGVGKAALQEAYCEGCGV